MKLRAALTDAQTVAEHLQRDAALGREREAALVRERDELRTILGAARTALDTAQAELADRPHPGKGTGEVSRGSPMSHAASGGTGGAASSAVVRVATDAVLSALRHQSPHHHEAESPSRAPAARGGEGQMASRAPSLAHPAPPCGGAHACAVASGGRSGGRSAAREGSKAPLAPAQSPAAPAMVLWPRSPCLPVPIPTPDTPYTPDMPTPDMACASAGVRSPPRPPRARGAAAPQPHPYDVSHQATGSALLSPAQPPGHLASPPGSATRLRSQRRLCGARRCGLRSPPGSPTQAAAVLHLSIERDAHGRVGVAHQGTRVIDVAPRGPAESCGIRSGDTIIAVAGRPVEQLDINAALDSAPYGRPYLISVRRPHA